MMKIVGLEQLQMRTVTAASTRTLMPDWVRLHHCTREPTAVSPTKITDIQGCVCTFNTKTVKSSFWRIYVKAVLPFSKAPVGTIINQPISWFLFIFHILFRVSERKLSDQSVRNKHAPQTSLQVRLKIQDSIPPLNSCESNRRKNTYFWYTLSVLRLEGNQMDESNYWEAKVWNRS